MRLTVLFIIALFATSEALSSSGRRAFTRNFVCATCSTLALNTNQVVHAATPTKPSLSLESLTLQIQQARQQLEAAPDFIKQEKWDSVRALLIKPPLSDCWTNSPRQPLLNQFAQALGDAGGDELAALEAREELISHLRYLDMAVYNNVFNPIATEGKTGATKELVRSYYEDPTREYKASVSGFDTLLELSKEVATK